MDSCNTESHSEWPLFVVRNSSGKLNEIMVGLQINNIPCTSELDTGASVAVIGENICKKQLGSVPLKKSQVTLKSYSGH